MAPGLGAWWKRPWPRSLIAARSAGAADRVIAGNDLLADWASSLCPDVVVIPTCVDPSAYRTKVSYELSDPPRLGWLGSPATEGYLLDIAPETFRLAAAIVLAAVGMFAVWRGRVAAAPGDGWQAGIFPAGIPLLAGPAGLAAALSLSADNGAGVSFAAAIAPVLLGGAAIAWLPGRSGAAADGLARLLGALLVVLAAAMAVDGVRSV